MENITNKLRYLILDSESGSRRASSTLLTVYFMVTDAQFNKLGELDLSLKPDEGVHYIVDAQGLSINKIDLVEHHKSALTNKQAKPLLYEFLKKYGSETRLVPVGHGVQGDIRRITGNLISEGSWEQFCTYHFIDTSVVLQFLRACGKMPMDTDGSVTAIAKQLFPNQSLNDLVPGLAHEAKFDAQMTALVLKEMIELGKQ